MGRLFGTDGVRGVANAELTAPLAFALGRALAARLAAGGVDGPVLVGRDTRISGDLLESALTAGVLSTGRDVVPLGIVPTPAVAYLSRNWSAAGGAMISASHNPVADNGIKFFGADGFKLTDAEEDEIARDVARILAAGDGADGLPQPTGAGVGRLVQRADPLAPYLDFLCACGEALGGLKVVIDCGNGAAYQASPQALRRLGAEVIVLNAEPDGTNINVDCGSTHPEVAQRAVIEHGADVGLAHDGDADRLIAVDETGGLVDGDHIMAICALERLRSGDLPGRAIACTVYSNLGLHKAIEAAGGRVVETPNGDRYVLEAMRSGNLAIGGEQSGHLIFLEHNTTGDGPLSAIQLLGALKRSGVPLSQLAACMPTYPQVLKNVRVRDKSALAQNGRVAAVKAEIEAALAGRGRLLLRTSGTEPVVRVMVEGPERAEVEALAGRLAQVVAEELA
ncbi:MAG TPA: phosphoglucosamine mutase [Limnochordia bacterium]|nr:phosphoglucosamine mutase [Limnochordia bacterium]